MIGVHFCDDREASEFSEKYNNRDSLVRLMPPPAPAPVPAPRSSIIQVI